MESLVVTFMDTKSNHNFSSHRFKSHTFRVLFQHFNCKRLYVVYDVLPLFFIRHVQCHYISFLLLLDFL